MLRLALIVPCVLASGCVPEYVPPTTANLPTLTVASSLNTFRVFENGHNCSNPVRIPSEFLKNGRMESLPVKEGQEIAVHSGYASGAYGTVTTCQLMVSFVPKAQSDYELRFAYDQAGKQCTAALYRKDRLTGRTAIDPSLRMRERLVPFLESQPFCVA